MTYTGYSTLLLVTFALLYSNATFVDGSEPGDEDYFRDEIHPLLDIYCFGCHANGGEEGGLSFDEFTSERHLLANRELWWKVLKNVRANIMPPAGEEQPFPEERKILTDWIKTAAFGVDPQNPDPGAVTLRRLNRAEYRNTIRDLMGVDFNAEVVFPPDDTGSGFDNVGEAMSLSPLLLEKYLQSAKKIVEQAVPTECKVVPKQRFRGDDFRSDNGSARGSRMSYDRAATVAKKLQVPHDGRYSLSLELQLHGSFEFDPQRCRVAFAVDGEELFEEEYGWDERRTIRHDFQRDWHAGEHELSFALVPVVPQKQENDDGGRRRQGDETFVNFHLQQVNIEGPVDRKHWQHPPNYERYFPRDEPPATVEQRREYAREVLGSFALRAYGRPPDAATLDRLVDLAEANNRQPNKTFEAGIAQAIVAILASPRFLFRIEKPQPDSDDRFPPIDEYSLASRLSYFLWSTMPDEQLLALADRGELRDDLAAQIDRMLADDRSDAFIRNFVGQWLRARDVEKVSIDPLAAFGLDKEYEQLRSVFRRRFRRGRSDPPVSEEELERVRARFRELREIRDKFDGDARRAMRRETEMYFEYIVREDRSLLEILDSDYTFVNEKLADLYDIEGVEGRRMRRVTLPEDSPRGGVLTQGTMLTVTSNPTRTSPVKRGLFVLENILGTPAPPAPPNVPELEESADKFGDREPTLREVLAAHREAPLCASCHARMDPLGLALENFNAIGMWRDEENDQPIDSSGELITGAAFKDIRQLKQILTADHRRDFYRCVTQKLMTYALGRGLEYYDEYVVDQIVERVDRQGGRFSVLLREVINSPPFQRQRRRLSTNDVSTATP